MSRKKSNKIPRRLLTVTMSCVFMISLSSCSGATNSYGNLDREGVYATSGAYSVTNGELWDELKWSSSTKLDTQITNIILQDQINKITLVMNNINKYDSLTDEEKKIFDNSKETFDSLGQTYSKRLADYVVQDIYNFSYSNDSYWDELEDLGKTDKKILEAKYVDELYSTYRVEKIDSTSITDLISNATEDNSNYLTIATNLTYIYYPQLAKELLAEEKIMEEVKTADEDDDDPEDDMLGYFSNSEYVSKFKSEFANKFDLSLVLIRFNTEDEFNDTLRAFGIKIYNKQLYYVSGKNADGTEKSYAEYCKYYDELSNSKLTDRILDGYVLEIYIQIYNYLYGGYRDTLSSGLTDLPQITQLNDLRGVTDAILNTPIESVHANAVEALKANEELTTYTRDELDEISTTFSTYLYETLDLEGTSYSTATQNYNNSYYIAFKFAEGEDTEYNNIYNKDLTDDDIIEIITREENANLKEQLHSALIRDKITESAMDTYVSDAKEEVKVKIYEEATEIAYAKDNSTYSKTLSSNKNKNVLATIEYNSKKWNVNIVADDTDENSVLIPGTTDKYGVFDDLETQYGLTTAIDIISTKIIKTTEAYEKTNEDRDFYNSYIESILYNFANDGYSSSGYSSSIGKYNFLMLYFHSADIDEIIDNFYRVQYASSKLLTDYSNDVLIEKIFKQYTDKLYDNYFSLEGSRLVVYFDADDDNEPDDVSDWKAKTVQFEGKETTLEQVAKELIYEVYTEINASTDSHSTKLEAIVEDINASARVAFNENPILVENQWAKYRKIGLRVKIEEFSVSNSSTDVDFNLKQRLYEYSDPNGEYQYFKNNTTPTIYIEPLSEQCVNTGDKQIVETEDGYNLILVTTGSSKPSAKWDKDEYDDNLLTNIYIKYNEKYTLIDNIYNDEDKLTTNQIRLYVLEYVSSQTTNLIPSALSSACSTFLSPVLTRFTGDETQRMILLEFINNYENAGEITYTKEGYNESFDKISEINKRTADEYIELYDDITGTSNSFPDWWENLSAYLNEIKEAK